jgi:hypothetical protein
MFWKKKPPREEPKIDKAPRQQRNALGPEEAAARLAASLLDYSDALSRELRTLPDKEVLEAKVKIDAATTIVLDGRLAYALGRAIPETIKSWPWWIKRDDFETLVTFDAKEIQALNYTEKDQIERDIKVVDVTFTFAGNSYRIILRERFSPTHPQADIELWDHDILVAHFYLRKTGDEFPHLEFDEISTFRVGPWMKDALAMAAQIDAFADRRRQKSHDDLIRKTAQNIELG